MALSVPAATLYQYKSYIKILFIQLITFKKFCTFLSIKTSYTSEKKQDDFNNVLVPMNFKLIQSKYTQTKVKKQVYTENSERKRTIGQTWKKVDREYRIQNTTMSGYKEYDVKRYSNNISHSHQTESKLLYRGPEGTAGGLVRRNTPLAQTNDPDTADTLKTTRINLNKLNSAQLELTALISMISYMFIGRKDQEKAHKSCLLYTSPSPRDRQKSRMPSSA